MLFLGSISLGAQKETVCESQFLSFDLETLLLEFCQKVVVQEIDSSHIVRCAGSQLSAPEIMQIEVVGL